MEGSIQDGPAGICSSVQSSSRRLDAGNGGQHLGR
jgi:hypothetical protein